MGTIFKREGKGNWYYEHKGAIKKRSLGTQNLQHAKRFALTLDFKVAQLKNGEIKPEDIREKERTDITFKQLYKDYQRLVIKPKINAVKPKKRGRKATYYRIKLDHFIKHWGNKFVRNFDFAEAEEYKSILSGEIVPHTGKVRTQKTIHNYLAEVKQMIGWAVNMKHLDDNPMTVIGFMPSTRATAPRKPLPLDWVEDAIENAKVFTDKVYWTILLHTGCRATDGGSLTPEVIETGIFQEKSGQYRKLMMTPDLINYGDMIYNICQGKEDQRKSRERFQKHISDNHNGYHTDLHSIRHTTVTYLINNGFDERQVGKILGTESSIGVYAEIDFNRCVQVITQNFKQFTA